MDVSRVVVCSPQDEMLFELAPADVFGRVRVEEVNGEHAIEITTTTVLSKEQRIITGDHTGKLHEWVVQGEDVEHTSGSAPFGTYYCVWSLQHDLTLTMTYKMPGTKTPVAASVGLAAALDGTSRWEVGTVTVTKLAGASMWDKNGWEALAILVETWGGEVDANIEVGSSGVVRRSVCLYEQLGSQNATRRFDWNRDLAGIRRKVSEMPVACRITPRGKGEETEGGGYGRKITIEDVNGGVDWIQNDETAVLVRLPDGRGDYEYPITRVENGDITDPQELKEWALQVLPQYTEPQVTYEADVVQLSQAGMDAHGIALGDAVQCVDRGFPVPGGLRVHGRVMRLVINELDESDVQVTIGSLARSLSDRLASMATLTATVRAMNGGTLTTSGYLASLLERLNGEVNATGGYTYVVQGNGMRTYDKAVSDPLVGTEATSVVEIKGGNIRIANSRTATGEWDWKTLISSGHIAAELVTSAHLVSGTIQNADGSFYVDLDGHTVNIGGSAIVGGRSVQDVLAGVDSSVTSWGVEYALSDSSTQAPTTGWQDTAPEREIGKHIWQRIWTVTGKGSEAVTTIGEPTCLSGADGLNQATVLLYQRRGEWVVVAEDLRSLFNVEDVAVAGEDLALDGSVTGETLVIAASQPEPPTVELTYVFATSSLEGSIGSWSREIPAEEGALWVTAATVSSNGATDVIAPTEWAAPVLVAKDGTDGVNSYVHVAWADGPDGSEGFSLTESYEKAYVGIYTDDTEEPSEDPISYSWSLIRGDTGLDGLNQATVLLYCRADMAEVVGETLRANDVSGTEVTGTTLVAAGTVSGEDLDLAMGEPLPPSSTLRYEFASGVLSGDYGVWSRTIPEGSAPCWVTSATAISTYETDTIAPDEWSAPTVFAGRAVSVVDVSDEYYLSTSASEPTGGSWSSEQPTWHVGTYIWTRLVTTWSDGTATASEPKVAGLYKSIMDAIAGLTDGLAGAYDETGVIHADLLAEIDEARRYATDYLTYENGELVLGVTGTQIKNVITATRQAYRTSAGDIAWYGLSDLGIWEMFIETASIQNLLRFGDFAWIARSNGNMTLKWTGA